MAAERVPGGGRFFGVAGVWVTGLVTLTLLYRVVTWPAQWEARAFGGVASFLPGWLGLLIPPAAFAGGLSVCRILSSRGVAARAVLLAALTYGLMAYGSPVSEYHRMISQGADAAVQFPFGPYTPGGLAAAREVVRANPPPAYSYRSSRPLEAPPNWWTYLLHSVVAVSAFAVLAAVLGHMTGTLTHGLPPPLRGNLRWAIGLATAVGFFAAEALGGEWVRSDPGNSGLIGAWYALSVPLAELAILLALSIRGSTRVRGPPPPGV